MALKVAIAGYGAEGEASAKYWLAEGAKVTIFDAKKPQRSVPAGCEVVIGEEVFQKLNGYDLVIRTPGLRPDAINTDGKIWSATNEFFAKCPAPIIGVTGTKGKGTTCSLITEILKAAGKTVHLVGNIGVPALDVLPKIKEGDLVVYELSSFQLWDIEKSPQVAVVLMIEPDHLDVHSSFEEYLDAKRNIRRYQFVYDTCIYHPTNEYAYDVASTEIIGLCDLCPESIAFAHKYAVKKDGMVYVSGGYFYKKKRKICAIKHLNLPGEHNLENACAAISAVLELDDITITNTQIIKGLENFKGLPHRLEFVAEKNGVKYYDDSFSTTTGSTKVALKSFENKIVLIFGGWDKGIDMSNFLKDNIKPDKHFLILIGDTAEKIASQCEQLGYQNYLNLGTQTNMDEIVSTAREHAQPSSVVLLSPAHASFGLFKSYYERGEKFKTAVKKLP